VIMSGMFYSFEEAAEKLNKSKDEIKKLVRDGQLREFRDGPNILFKVEEIEALLPKEDISGPSEAEEPVELEAEMDVPELAEKPSMEPVEKEQNDEILAEEPHALEPEPEELSEEPIGLAPESEEKTSEPEGFQDFDMDTSIFEAPEEEKSEPEENESAKAEDEDLDSILLAPETGNPVSENDLTDGDTALTGQGTSILGKTDNDYELTDDTMAETAIIDGTKGGSGGQEGLEEIEEDVKLDSFGSGSGLLDLSLQADDTSLGGILDEIYTDENKEPSAKEAEPGPDVDMAAIQEEGAMAGAGEEEIMTPQIEPDGAMALGPVVAQAPPDSQSNILGMILVLPIIAVLYAAIVALAGIRGIIPSILKPIQIWVWPIMGVMGLISVIITVAAFMLTGERRSPVAKEKKIKPPKVKKEKIKPPKKEKPPKEDKKAKKAK
jgi:excisionase family DNA binding protein